MPQREAPTNRRRVKRAPPLTSGLVREFVRGEAKDRRVAEGIQRRTAAQQFGVSHAGGVCARNRRRRRLWKRRCMEKSGRRLSHSDWKSRKRRGIPTFSQPRRRRSFNQRCCQPPGCRSMTRAEIGGRSVGPRVLARLDTKRWGPSRIFFHHGAVTFSL